MAETEERELRSSAEGLAEMHQGSKHRLQILNDKCPFIYFDYLIDGPTEELED